MSPSLNKTGDAGLFLFFFFNNSFPYLAIHTKILNCTRSNVGPQHMHNQIMTSAYALLINIINCYSFLSCT